MRFCGYVLLVSMLLFFASCTGSGTLKTTDNNGKGRFTIITYPSWKKVIVTDPWQGSRAVKFEYYLFHETAQVPDSLKSKAIIRTPVHRIICMSTTHLPMIYALGSGDAIKGISGRSLIYNPDLRKRLEAGEVKDVGYETSLDKELIVSLKPDLLMAYGVNPASAGYMNKLGELGVKVMFDADYLEQDPLKRAEWIKVFGALFEKSNIADSIFNKVTASYNSLRDSVLLCNDKKPVVLLGGPWENSWYIAPSDTYVTRLLRDAGAKYLFEDLKAEHAVPYSVEKVYSKASAADVWLNPGSARSLEELYSFDYRLKNLQVCKSGKVYSFNKRVTAEGGNDYWESAVIRPDLVLRDMVSVFHPSLLQGYNMQFCRKLE